MGERRVLLKLSGELLCARGGFGVEPDPLWRLAQRLRRGLEGARTELALVLGGGNFLRGAKLSSTSAEGVERVVVIGTDCPLLKRSDLVTAIEKLRSTDVVLGPAEDGGYYLIGLKQPHAGLFSGIPWGTPRVTQRTLERAAQMQLETVLLPEWYDVDDAETLGWLRAELNGSAGRFRSGGPAAWTRACLAEMERVAS